jgi:hypothetical protein
MQHPWLQPAQSFQLVRRGLRSIALLATTCLVVTCVIRFRKIVSVSYKAGELTIGTCQNVYKNRFGMHELINCIPTSNHRPLSVAAHISHPTGLTFVIMLGPRAAHANIMIIIFNRYDTWMPYNLKYITSGYHPQRWYRVYKIVYRYSPYAC